MGGGRMSNRKKKTPASDIRFQDSGSVCILYAESNLGKWWVAEHVAAEMVWCGGIACERRYAGNIAEGAQADGLAVAWG